MVLRTTLPPPVSDHLIVKGNKDDEGINEDSSGSSTSASSGSESPDVTKLEVSSAPTMVQGRSFSSSFFQDSLDGPSTEDTRLQLSQFYVAGMAKYLKVAPSLELVEEVMEDHLKKCHSPLDILDNNELFRCASQEERLAVEQVLAQNGPRVYVPVHAHMLKTFGPA